MDVHNVELVMSAVAPAQYPTDGMPEIALSGRSNVGKSSLINTLINRKSYARTSSQPGKTQTLNFYNVEQKLFFVDVPGYGYAKVSKTERAKWGQMIETYLAERTTLRGVISLVDARHEPTKLDVQMVDFLHYYDIPVLVVATKSDKISRGKWNQHESVIRRALSLTPEDDFVLFSAQDKSGKEEVWQWIEKHANLGEENGI
ncbi:ribosome biogenesis GTP-binding protein YihA/YsxC [Dellaglioa sp. BT-FLS60]